METVTSHTNQLSFREANQSALTEFVQRGFLERHLFPHQIFYLPKCGPDGLKLATRMCGQVQLSQLWEVVLYAMPPVLDRFPPEIFFDPDIAWHQQHFGRNGQVATANLVVGENTLHSMVHQSDLVQRISRRRELKTQVENRFKGWNHLLLNAILAFAVERNISSVYLPTADLALRNTDPRRNVGREMFERIYDRTVHRLYDAERVSDWWLVDVSKNRERVVVPEKKSSGTPRARTICLCHDVERGHGHANFDTRFAQSAHRDSPAYLEDMLLAEQSANVKATYHVMGAILPEVRARIEAGGHCVAFHSFDHRVEKTTALRAWFKTLRPGPPIEGQLPKCRSIDYRLKGYRPPQSFLTPELSDENLCFHNFEWLASSAYSLGGQTGPAMTGRLVKLPILFDDFDLYLRKVSYAEWERAAFRRIEENAFVAFSLHDCYAHFWLPYYRRFLETIRSMGQLKTFDQVASDVILSHSQ